MQTAAALPDQANPAADDALGFRETDRNPAMTTALTAIDLTAFAPAHIPAAVALSRQAGWPHRPEDWALTLSVSCGVVALDAGRVVGTALCSVFGPVATLNMIIVEAGWRGKGLGAALMARIIDLAGPRELRLVATEDGLPLYSRLGFQPTGRICQHQGVAVSPPPGRAVRGGPADPSGLAAMDRAASGMDRAGLIERLADTGEVLRCDGGFAILRAFGRGHVLGPVVARDAAAAQALMAAAASRMVGRFLRIDLPEHVALGDHARALGLDQVGGGVSMIRAPAPRAVSEFQTYALVSQALG